MSCNPKATNFAAIMKTFYLALCLCVFSGNAFCQVKISAEIKNAPVNAEVNLTYFNNIIEWQKISARETSIDKHGKFDLNL